MAQYILITIKFYLAKTLIFILLKIIDFKTLEESIKPESTFALPYQKMQFDELLPIIDHPEKLDYKQLLEEYQLGHGKPLDHIKRREPSAFDPKTTCPFCNAPYEFIYDNNGARGQFLCKVCNSTFHISTDPNAIIMRCPYCRKILSEIKERYKFFIYKCVNDNCCFYQHNLRSLSKEQGQDFKSHPYNYKLHYIFRDFKFSILQLKSNSPNKPKIDLAKAHKPPNVIGIVLSFFANFGLSSRMISEIMNVIFDVRISHQTVLNYVNYTAYILNPFVGSFKHLLDSPLVGDETWIKIRGRWNYLFFIFNPKKQIILANFISQFRDVFAASSAILQSINSTLNKDIFRTLSSNKPLFVFDGNPSYQLARLFFTLNNIFFDLQVVKGLQNRYLPDFFWRPYKEQIERLIRTFKDHYRHTNGFDCINGAVSFTILFTAYFNFLRPNRALNRNVPIPLEQLQDISYMPAKWLKLIELAQQSILQGQKPLEDSPLKHPAFVV